MTSLGNSKPNKLPERLIVEECDKLKDTVTFDGSTGTQGHDYAYYNSNNDDVERPKGGNVMDRFVLLDNYIPVNEPMKLLPISSFIIASQNLQANLAGAGNYNYNNDNNNNSSKNMNLNNDNNYNISQINFAPPFNGLVSFNSIDYINNSSRSVSWEDVPFLNTNTATTTTWSNSDFASPLLPNTTLPFPCTNINIGDEINSSHSSLKAESLNYKNFDATTRNDKISVALLLSSYKMVNRTDPISTEKNRISKNALQAQMKELDKKIKNAAKIELQLLDQCQRIRYKRLRMMKILQKMEGKLTQKAAVNVEKTKPPTSKKSSAQTINNAT